MPPALLKTMTYSLMHLSVAVTVAFALTGNWKIALSVGLIEPAVQTVAYTLHERAWLRFGGPAAPVPHACALGATV